MLQWLQDYSNRADWLVGGGTIFLGIVAIFAPRIDRWWRYPKLEILLPPIFLDRHPDDTKMLVMLCIKNNRGLAEKAEVFLDSVIRKDAHKKNTPVPSIAPMSFRWHHRETGNPEIFVTISRGMRRYFVLGAMTQSPEKGNGIYFQLWTEARLTPTSNTLDPGEYVIDLHLGAADGKPKAKRIGLSVPASFDKPKITLL